MTDAEATLVAGISGAIIGGVIGVIGTYIGSIRISQQQRFVDAGRRLREAFHDEMATLRSDRHVNAATLLEDAFKKHLIAVTEFSYVLPESKRSYYYHTWNDYCSIPDHPGATFFEQYLSGHGNIQDSENNVKLAIERINNILSFTKN